MSPPDGNGTLTLNDSQAEEVRMRAALGLTPDRAQGGRLGGEAVPRPVRDGAAMAARRAEPADHARARLTALEAELKAERAERAAAQQALAEAQRVIQQLQTKLAHGEMAAEEALQAERKARLAAEARAAHVPAAQPEDRPAGAKRRGRPPKVHKSEPPEQEPVQWWLPADAGRAKRARPKA